MKVTPVDRKVGKYSPGDEFELRDDRARILIKIGRLKEVGVEPPKRRQYRRRDMRAESTTTDPVTEET